LFLSVFIQKYFSAHGLSSNLANYLDRNDSTP
jgi:hypothetical protein